MSKKPHKHAELIKAWADGETIEIYSHYSGEWKLAERPVWCEDSEYRVKPSDPKFRAGDLAYIAEGRRTYGAYSSFQDRVILVYVVRVRRAASGSGWVYDTQPLAGVPQDYINSFQQGVDEGDLTLL